MSVLVLVVRCDDTVCGIGRFLLLFFFFLLLLFIVTLVCIGVVLVENFGREVEAEAADVASIDIDIAVVVVGSTVFGGVGSACVLIINGVGNVVVVVAELFDSGSDGGGYFLCWPTTILFSTIIIM